MRKLSQRNRVYILPIFHANQIESVQQIISGIMEI